MPAECGGRIRVRDTQGQRHLHIGGVALLLQGEGSSKPARSLHLAVPCAPVLPRAPHPSAQTRPDPTRTVGAIRTQPAPRRVSRGVAPARIGGDAARARLHVCAQRAREKECVTRHPLRACTPGGRAAAACRLPPLARPAARTHVRPGARPARDSPRAALAA